MAHLMSHAQYTSSSFIFISVCEKENVVIALCGWFGVGLRDRGGVDYCMCC